jgi:hypothetical protein
MTESENMKDDFSIETSKKQIRKTTFKCMMTLGGFEPHTIEEAERRLDVYYTERKAGKTPDPD